VWVVILAYVLLRWYDRPIRAWLAKKHLDSVDATVPAITDAAYLGDRPEPLRAARIP
jgi:peptidoglycan/LPS O-acetylase OafA/YrhL